MNDLQNLQNEYLKDEHMQQQEDEENNLEPQQLYITQQEDPADELEINIMEQIIQLEQKEDTISADLEKKLVHLLSRISNQSQEEIVRLRMNQLAISKILVYTHGKSQFRLVMAHHHMGKAYLGYKCYEQAIDHLTLALKKNNKLGDFALTKLYHSYILTTLSKCYYEINSYEDVLEVLSRAQDIQNICFSESNDKDRIDVETTKLMSQSYAKLKQYEKAQQFIDKAIAYEMIIKGEKSKEVAHLIIEKAKICAEEKKYSVAIQIMEKAIGTLLSINYSNKLQLIDLYEQLAVFYEKNNQPDKQIENLLQKLELTVEIYDELHKNTLKTKRTITALLIKHGKSNQAIRILEEILEGQEKIYGQTSLHVGKTLKMLGIVFMSLQNETNTAQHYLKKAQKILQQNGNTRLVKEIKSKLNTLKENKQKRMNAVIQQ